LVYILSSLLLGPDCVHCGMIQCDLNISRLQFKSVLKAAITIAIRLRFDYHDNYQNCDSTSIRLVKVGQYVNEGMNSCQMTFYFWNV